MLVSIGPIVTEAGDTLKNVKSHKKAIRNLMEQDQQTAAAKRRFLTRIRNAPDRGTGGRVAWTRDKLHER